ncbi:hypothetical protein F4781DRAFT_296636 [Annulohypoxylon bovei var. microspora]|nr:hypothetical protein F4781DRAFT_296636 [Annulohypoxylon bovei var. microspora]
MMSFPNAISRLLRTLFLSWHAIGSTNRTHESGGGSSGADFYAAELELQPWPATSSTTRKSARSATVATRCAERRNCHEIPLPEPPRPAIIRTRKVGAGASPISRATSFDSDASTTSREGSGTSDSIEGRATKPRWNAATYRKAVRKKQQASQLCWREYWG